MICNHFIALLVLLVGLLVASAESTHDAFRKNDGGVSIGNPFEQSRHQSFAERRHLSDEDESDDSAESEKVKKELEKFEKEMEKKNFDKAKKALEEAEIVYEEEKEKLGKKKEEQVKKKDELDLKEEGIKNKKKKALESKSSLSKKSKELEELLKKKKGKLRLLAEELEQDTEQPVDEAQAKKELGQVGKELKQLGKELRGIYVEEYKVMKEVGKIESEIKAIDKSMESLDKTKTLIDNAEMELLQAQGISPQQQQRAPETVKAPKATESTTSMTTTVEEQDTGRDRLPTVDSKSIAEDGSPRSGEMPTEAEEEDFDFFVGLTPHAEHCPEPDHDNMDQIMTAVMRVAFQDLDVWFEPFNETEVPDMVRRLQTTTRRNRFGYTGHACRRCINNRRKRRSGGRERSLFEETIDAVDDPLEFENIATRMSDAIEITVVETFAADPLSCLGRGRPPEISVQLMVPAP